MLREMNSPRGLQLDILANVSLVNRVAVKGHHSMYIGKWGLHIEVGVNKDKFT